MEFRGKFQIRGITDEAEVLGSASGKMSKEFPGVAYLAQKICSTSVYFTAYIFNALH